MLLKGREDAKKKASIFNHKIEGNMIKKKGKKGSITHLLCSFFSRSFKSCVFQGTLCLCTCYTFFFKLLVSRVISSVKSSLCPPHSPHQAEAGSLYIYMLHIYLSPARLPYNCFLYFMEVLINLLCLLNKTVHSSH